MTPYLRITALLLASLAALPVLPSSAGAQSPAASSAPRKMSAAKPHRVVIQVSENDPKIMNLALNNAENITKFYEQAGEKVQVEIVAYGPGLNMVRNDTSPVKDRVAALVSRPQNVTFSGCANTLSNQSKQEGKEITLLPEAKLVPTGIARIVQLQEQGWTYVRP
jgi:hypothetical protein